MSLIGIVPIFAELRLKANQAGAGRVVTCDHQRKPPGGLFGMNRAGRASGLPER
jgi:hypothetical protein